MTLFNDNHRIKIHVYEYSNVMVYYTLFRCLVKKMLCEITLNNFNFFRHSTISIRRNT